jgi:hypothetical protein
MNRRKFVTMTTIGAASSLLSGAASEASASDPEPQDLTQKRPKLLVFDVN